MIKKSLLSIIAIFSIITFCLAAEITGKWIGQLRTPDGNEFPVSYTLNAEGETLNGTVTIPDSELTITDGKIKGNDFSFTVTYQGTPYLNEGKLSGDSLKVKVHFGDEIVESTLKREEK
ncbi:MAG TPA: hypothetical protein VGE24_08030 [Emticicia sp.]